MHELSITVRVNSSNFLVPFPRPFRGIQAPPILPLSASRKGADPTGPPMLSASAASRPRRLPNIAGTAPSSSVKSTAIERTVTEKDTAGLLRCARNEGAPPHSPPTHLSAR
jgi:hypothetical protein